MSSLRHNYTAEEPVEKTFEPLPDGEYPCEVSEVFAWETSTAGNDYREVKLTVGEPGNTRSANDKLVFIESCRWKIDGFAKTFDPKFKIGAKIDWEDMSWAQGQRGRCVVGTEKWKKDGKEYSKNVVTRYVWDKKPTGAVSATSQPAASPAVSDDEDDIPF